MPDFPFYATSSNNYDQNNNKHNSGHLHQGYGADGHHHSDNQRAMVIFDSADIRAKLAGHTVQSCTLNWTVYDVEGTQCVFFIGTHNYTALPNSAASSRMATDRVRYSFSQNMTNQTVSGVSIGATIGQEFKDGVTTGIMFGPAATSPTDNGADILPHTETTATRRPYIVITATPSNVKPDPPTLLTPAANSVGDLSNAGGVFTWTHNDPNGDPQAAFRFRRNKGGGVYDYWNGTTFVSTDTRIASSAQTVTIPAGQWANNTAYSWSVQTEDPGGLISDRSVERVVYASNPPVATITAPAGNVTVARPTLRWTFSDPDGQPQYGWIAQVVPSEVYNVAGYNPDNYTSPAFSTSGAGATSSLVSPVDLVNHKTYRAYVKVASSPLPTSALQYSQWATSTFTIIVPPFAPSMVFPQNGGTADLSAGFSMDWNNTFYGPGSQTAFAIRRIVAGGGYQWWNGLNWNSTTEVLLSGTQSQYAFRPTEIANGQTFTFSVAILDDFNQKSPYSPGATVTGSAQAQVTIISPRDVAITTQPLVQWTAYDPENDPQQTYQVRILAEATYTGQGATWNPGTATAVWDTGELTDPGGLTRSAVVSTNLTNGSTYRAYVRVKTGGVYSGWTYSEFQVSLIGPATPEMTAVVDPDNASIVISIQGRDSFFTPAVAGNFSGWQANTNATVSNQVFFASAHSSRISTMTATATGGMRATTSDAYPVYPGQVYTAAATISMATGTAGGGQQAFIELHFTDAADAEVGRVGGNIILDDSAQRSSVTAAAPDNAVNARIRVQIVEAPVGAVHAWFDPVFRTGTGGEWSPGGLVGLTKVSVRDIEHDRLIRRAQQVPVPTTTQLVTLRDEEIHIGEQHDYEVVTSTVYPGGAVLTSEPGMIGPLIWTSGWLWLSDPLRVNTARPFGPQSLGDIVRPIRQGKFRPLGRADAVVTTGTRGLREGSFKLVTWTREEREAFQELVETSGVLLLRVPPDQGDTRGDTIFIRVQGDSPEARPLPHRTPHRTIEQAWVEQYRPLDLLEWDDEGS
jgi:hypothetical protein